MTNYQELKRLAEAAKLELADIANVVIEDGDLSHHELFQSLASPDVVLGLIKSLEHTTMAAEAEAKEVDERNAVIAGLRTQNQALMEALERMVESVTGVDQVSAVDEARAALTAAKQAQPSQADAQDAARYRWLRSTTNWASNSSNERIDVRNCPELWDAAIDAAINAKERATHCIKQGGQHD